MNESIVSDMSISVNHFAMVNEEVNISGSMSLKVEMNGSQPQVPTTADLELYEEVAVFSILSQFLYTGMNPEE
jgi:hypothetical protein